MKRLLLVGMAAIAGWVEAAERDVILLPATPTKVELTAANELKAALKQVTDFDYRIVTGDAIDGERVAYAVGATKFAARLNASQKWPAKYEIDEVRRGSVDGCVALYGDATRGAIYSVDLLLEDIVGVRWWTTNESFYPKKTGWRPSVIAPYRYVPPFKYRDTFYRSTLTDPDFKVRAKINSTSYTRYIIPPTKERFIPEEKGGNHKLVFFKGRRSAYHSFFEVLPPKKYAKDHPDWYSEIKGKRIGGGQLCVTNPEMFKEYVKNTLQLLRENPDCDAIQVSQNDEGEHTVCQCAKCVAAKEAEGSWSGPYIDFANRVAEAVEKEFPNVAINTFAYMFTRKAPKTVRPRRNVLVMLCDIECAFNQPLEGSTYELNQAFMRDLKEWSKVAAGHLYLWNYQANFSSYVLPHPNFQTLAPNLRTFLANGAVGVFEQGDAMCPIGDFCALKCYVTSHIMWDPSKDPMALADEFLCGYYGPKAAGHMKRVLEVETKSATRPDCKALPCYHHEAMPWITPEAGREALAEMDAALREAAADGAEYVRRVRMAKMAWNHAAVIEWENWGLKGDRVALAESWIKALDEFGIDAVHETTTRKSMEDYLPHLRKIARGEIKKQ